MDASDMPRRETPERGDGAERRAGGGAARAGPALERGAQARGGAAPDGALRTRLPAPMAASSGTPQTAHTRATP